MRFSDWYSFQQTEQETPSKAGLFQVRVADGLLNYPQGKSAMFYYGYANNLKAGLQKYRSEVAPLLEVNEETLLVRWMETADTEARFQNHLNSFLTQFGTMPLGNEMLLRKRASRKGPATQD